MSPQIMTPESTALCCLLETVTKEAVCRLAAGGKGNVIACKRPACWVQSCLLFATLSLALRLSVAKLLQKI